MLLHDYTEQSPQLFAQHDVRGMKDNSSDHNISISISLASTLIAAYTELCVFMQLHQCRLLNRNSTKTTMQLLLGAACSLWLRVFI